MAFLCPFLVVVVAQRLPIGQALLAEFALGVVGVLGDEAMAVDVAAVLDQSSLVVIGKPFVAVGVSELSQAT